jgi:hypothetical protein
VVTDLRKEPRRGSLLGGGWPHSRVVVESHLRKETANQHREHREQREREERARSEEREKNQLK